MNRNEIAKALDVSAVTITTWTEREQMPCERRGSRGVGYDYDLDACRSWLLVRTAIQRGARADDLREFAKSFCMSGGGNGPLMTTTAEAIASTFGWTWSALRECIAFGLPFATAGKAGSAEGWTFATALILPWVATTCEMLKRNGIDCETLELPLALRGLRMHADIKLVTPQGYRQRGAA